MAANDVAEKRASRDAAESRMLEATANGFRALAISKAHWALHEADDAYIDALEARLREVEAERDTTKAALDNIEQYARYEVERWDKNRLKPTRHTRMLEVVCEMATVAEGLADIAAGRVQEVTRAADLLADEGMGEEAGE